MTKNEYLTIAFCQAWWSDINNDVEGTKKYFKIIKDIKLIGKSLVANNNVDLWFDELKCLT